MPLLVATLALGWASSCGGSAEAAEPGSAEILWDDCGVPHVFAPNEEALFRAFGWAQARAHGELLLKLYGESRGRAAELWGPSFLDSDRWVHTRGIPDRARAWYAEQEPSFRRNLDAFAEGVNAFVREYPDALEARYQAVLPVSGVDVLAHQQRVLHFTFLGDGSATAGEGPGSYGWAVAPERTSAGHTLLMANPHLPWGDLHLFFEAHLSMPGLSLYGASLVGFPVLGIAFGPRHGWTHTFNTLDGVDLYALETDGDRYLLDGDSLPLDVERVSLRVRRGRDEYEEVEHRVRRSVHGPIVGVNAEEGGGELALRVAGLDRARALEQWWRMARAEDLEEFEAALRLQQLPLFTVIYGDRTGNVLHAFGGHAPRRPAGELDWRRPVPGSTASTLWNELHDYAELPRVLNPASGWVQNANDPPWTATLPALDPDAFSAGLAPRFLHHQAQRSLRLLVEDASMSFTELEAYKRSTRVELADRLVEPVVEAAERAASAEARRGAEILARWDRRVSADSRGAVLFLTWLHQFQRGDAVFAEPWSEGRPLETPAGLADPARAIEALAAAVRAVEERHGGADVAWGEVFRLRSLDGGDAVDEPCSGGMRALGVMRSFDFVPDGAGSFLAAGGDSFVALVEFADPPRARVALTYGNRSRDGVPVDTAALERAARGEYRDALLSRPEIEARKKLREWVAPEDGS